MNSSINNNNNNHHPQHSVSVRPQQLSETPNAQPRKMVVVHSQAFKVYFFPGMSILDIQEKGKLHAD